MGIIVNFVCSFGVDPGIRSGSSSGCLTEKEGEKGGEEK